jgi:hypothetical protein
VIVGQEGIIAVYPAAHVRARLRSPKTWAGPMCRLWSRLTISEWLDLCGIDLYEKEVHWLHDKLDEFPDLRFQAKETSGQCVAWRIYAGNVDIWDWNHSPAWTVGPCTILMADS